MVEKGFLNELFLIGVTIHPNSQKAGGKHTHFLRRFQCIPLRLEVYGWIKRSLKFVRALGSPRTKKMLAAGPDLGFCTSTLKSFRLLPHFQHLTLRFDISGYKISILLLGQIWQSWVFGLIFCLPDPVPH